LKNIFIKPLGVFCINSPHRVQGQAKKAEYYSINAVSKKDQNRNESAKNLCCRETETTLQGMH
jgi:hypothetical protein